MLFLRRAHSPDSPPLDSSPLPADYKTRALTNAPSGTLTFVQDLVNCDSLVFQTGADLLLRVHFLLCIGAYSIHNFLYEFHHHNTIILCK